MKGEEWYKVPVTWNKGEKLNFWIILCKSPSSCLISSSFSWKV